MCCTGGNAFKRKLIHRIVVAIAGLKEGDMKIVMLIFCTYGDSLGGAQIKNNSIKVLK